MSDGLPSIDMPEQVLFEEAFERPREATLESIVAMPTWREVLVEMVHQNEIDPWNVDVAQVANKYLEAVRGLQMDDLRIPANLILAASILIRFKSDMINLDEEPQQTGLDDFMDDFDSNEIPQLELTSRIAPKSRITLDDLVEAVESVMNETQKRDEKIATKKANEVFIEPLKYMDIKVSEFKIEDQVSKLLEKIQTGVDSQNLVTFNSLLEKRDKQSIVFAFLPLLFLANEGKVVLSQEPFFGEIFIRLADKVRSD